MKLAIIVNSFPSISEKFLLNQIICISEIDKNIDFTVIAGVQSKDIRQHKLFTSFSFYNRLVNLNIPYTKLKRVIAFTFVFLFSFFKSPYKTLLSLSVKRYSTAALNLKNLFFLKFFNGKHFDIIHCHFGQNGLIGSFLKDCGFCDRLIVTFHGSDITSAPVKYGSAMYKHLFKRADQITAGSNYIKNILIGYGGNSISLLPMGINVLPLNHSHPGKHFLSIGRLVKIKGYKYAIAAFKLISDSFPDTNYYIAGNGPLYNELIDQIKQLNLENRVSLLGEIIDSEMEVLFENTLALVFPGIRDTNGAEEGQGLVIQEAAIRGIPVIGTNTGGIPESIIDGKTGWIVNEKDSDSIAEKMRYFIMNAGKAKEFGMNGYIYTSNKYDNKEITSKLIKEVYNIYDDL